MKEKYLPGVFLLFVLGALAAIPLRVTELLFSIDSSGFYLTGKGVVPVLNILLVVLTVALLVPFFVTAVPCPLARHSSRLTAAIAALVGIFFIGDIGARMGQVFSSSTLLASNGSAVVFGDLLISIAALLAAIYFFQLAVAIYTQKPMSFSVTALFPLIWGVLILTVSFMQYTTIANISEQLFDVLKMVFMLLFLYYNARVTGRMPNGKEMRGIFAFGLPAALFVLVTVPPRMVAHLINSARGSAPGMEGILYLLLAAYILDLLAESYLHAKREGDSRPYVDYESDDSAGKPAADSPDAGDTANNSETQAEPPAGPDKPEQD